jgi:ribonuclease HI
MRKLIFSLGQYTTVFQAEVYAIKACSVENLNGNYKNSNIYILSDSQAAIKALGKHQITSKNVSDCHQSIIKLAKHNRYWCQVMRVLLVMERQISWQKQDLNIRS